MFRIPDYFKMDMTWDEAVRTIQGRGKGDLLGGMEEMELIWSEHCVTGDEDSDFYENWIYEVNAFNVVFEGMSKLFAPKETV